VRRSPSFSFIMGNGDAAIDLESFEGLIRLGRASSPPNR
jgi:hypothetical protein